MQKTHLISVGSKFLTTTLLSLALALPALAAPKAKQPEPPQTASTLESSSAGQARYGLGYSSAQFFNLAPTSILGVIELSGDNAIHALLSIPSASPFQFSAGGIFKHIAARNGRAAFHFGAGLALGTMSAGNNNSTDFLISVGGVVGIQAPFPGTENIMVHFDGGPGLTILGDNKDFGFGALSSLLGLSVVYMF